MAGCTPVHLLKPVAYPMKAWPHHLKMLSAIDHWKLSGVVSVQQGRHVQTANIDWLQNKQNFLIELYGPLGLGAVTLSGHPGYVKLHRGQKFYQADNAVVLMHKILGWSVPVLGVRYWIRGLPVPDMHGPYRLNQYGLLLRLWQQGWTIQFSQYMAIGQYGLPCKLVMSRENLRITLVVDHWEIF